MPDNKYIGFKIKELRTQKKITQKQLGELIGKTESSIQKYECGSVEVPLSVLEKIANVLDISILTLMDISQILSLAQTNINLGNPDMADSFLSIAEIMYKKKYPLDVRLQASYELLNNAGKEKAVSYLEDLTKIEEYQCNDTQEINETQE